MPASKTQPPKPKNKLHSSRTERCASCKYEDDAPVQCYETWAKKYFHVMEKHSSKFFRCPYAPCKESFMYLINLNEHIDAIHLGMPKLAEPRQYHNHLVDLTMKCFPVKVAVVEQKPPPKTVVKRRSSASAILENGAEEETQRVTSPEDSMPKKQKGRKIILVKDPKFTIDTSAHDGSSLEGQFPNQGIKSKPAKISSTKRKTDSEIEIFRKKLISDDAPRAYSDDDVMVLEIVEKTNGNKPPLPDSTQPSTSASSHFMLPAVPQENVSDIGNIRNKELFFYLA